MRVPGEILVWACGLYGSSLLGILSVCCHLLLSINRRLGTLQTKAAVEAAKFESLDTTVRDLVGRVGTLERAVHA